MQMQTINYNPTDCRNQISVLYFDLAMQVKIRSLGGNHIKKKICIGIICILGLIFAWMIISGYSYQTSVYITDDFIVSEDGSEIKFTVGVASSMGYVRGFKDEGGGVKPHYLKFYSAWGGLNSSIGAKSEYILRLDPDDTEIYVYHGDSGYTLALEKDSESGEWIRVR